MPTLGNKAILTSPKSNLPNTIASSISKGITEKTILEDQQGIFYLAKKPDQLTIEDVFSGYLPQEELQKAGAEAKAHIFSLQIEQCFLEILIPRMANRLFNGVLRTPETFLHVDEENSIWIISKFLNGFSEFLAKKEIVKEKDPLFYQTNLPKRADLQLNAEEATIIGQLYAVALVFNLWDLLNSKLLNSGYCLLEENKKIAAIVDFGCSAHISYKGRHNDTLPLTDPLFSPHKSIDYSFFGQTFREHYRHGHVLPFDSLVAPLLPHTIIADLFDMSATDIISQNMLQGFINALSIAEHNLRDNPNLLQEALDDAYNGISLDSTIQSPELKLHLNNEFYNHPVKGKHTLIGIIQDRLRETIRLIPQFKNGVLATSIQEQVRDSYYVSQLR